MNLSRKRLRQQQTKKDRDILQDKRRGKEKHPAKGTMITTQLGKTIGF